MTEQPTLRRGIAVLTAACMGVSLWAGGSAAAVAAPTVRGVSVCTEQYPFATAGFVTGLQPNTSYGVRAVFTPGGSVGTLITTDATGASPIGSILSPSPFEARIILWPDLDGNAEQNPGEPTVVDQTFVVDRPCTDARPKLPVAKDQCKNGGWETYGVFKNQGDCVSFVATGGKNQPSGH